MQGETNTGKATEMTQFIPMECRHGDVLLQAQVVRPAGEGPFPAVLVMHSALGLLPRVLEVATRLADLGYLAVATDMYGKDADIGTLESASAYYLELAKTPDLLRDRTVAWRDAVAARDDVDASRIAAIGYCFGGMCVLELARSGADVKAVVAYHGILTTHAPARAGTIAGEVAVYAGGQDPYAPLDHIEALRAELADAGASHQIMLFGNAEHGFTDPDAADTALAGVSYDLLADRVSWAGTVALLETVL